MSINAVTDEDHILDLLARYARYADERESSAWGQLFADDATFAPRSGGHYMGRAAIQTWFEDLFRGKGPHNRSLHFCCNPAISISADEAEAVSDVVVCETDDDQPWRIYQVNRYFDRFVRQNGQWLFSNRRIEGW